MIRYAPDDRPPLAPGDDITEWTEEYGPTKPAQLALIAKNVGVSNEDQNYIRDVLKTIHEIDNELGGVTSQGRRRSW